jgi:hypothetical protein
VLWWLFAMTAMAFVPVAALVAGEPDARGEGLVLLGLALCHGRARPALGSRAGVPGAVLARRAARPRRRSGRPSWSSFEAAHRYLGVAVGEHLGYLLTGAWTIVVGVSLSASPVHPDWLGWIGIVVGAALVVSSLSSSPGGDRGWSVAEKLVPIAYLAWSAWLVVLGLVLVLGIA